jgi:hypothetical protein
MVDVFDFIPGNDSFVLRFIRENGAFISLALLVYCAWQLRRIAKGAESTRYLLFRDYEAQVVPK